MVSDQPFCEFFGRAHVFVSALALVKSYYLHHPYFCIFVAHDGFVSLVLPPWQLSFEGLDQEMARAISLQEMVSMAYGFGIPRA